MFILLRSGATCRFWDIILENPRIISVVVHALLQLRYNAVQNYFITQLAPFSTEISDMKLSKNKAKQSKRCCPRKPHHFRGRQDAGGLGSILLLGQVPLLLRARGGKCSVVARGSEGHVRATRGPEPTPAIRLRDAQATGAPGGQARAASREESGESRAPAGRPPCVLTRPTDAGPLSLSAREGGLTCSAGRGSRERGAASGRHNGRGGHGGSG